MQVSQDAILNKIRKKLKRIAPNSKAILFGSRARVNPAPNSDWDILILLDKEKAEIVMR
jgi:predicted nucleotidyltransferase